MGNLIGCRRTKTSLPECNCKCKCKEPQQNRKAAKRRAKKMRKAERRRAEAERMRPVAVVPKHPCGCSAEWECACKRTDCEINPDFEAELAEALAVETYQSELREAAGI